MRQSLRLILNAAANLLGQAARLIAGFILPPFVVSQLGKDSYGTVVMLTSVLQFITLVEMGTARALNRFVAEELALGRREELSRVLSTGLTLLTTAASVAALLLIGVLAFPGRFLVYLDSLSLETIRWTILVMGLTAVVSIPLSMGNVAFYATERFRTFNAIQIVGTVLRVILVFVLLGKFPSSILAYACANSIPMLLVSGVVCLMAFRLLPQATLSIKLVTRRTLKRITAYGVEIFVNTFVFLLFVQANYFIIGKTLGPAAITTFNLAVIWGMVLRTVTGTAAAVILPSAAGKNAVGDTGSLRVMLVRSTKHLLLVSLVPVLFLVVFRSRVMLAWMGEGFDESATLMVPLLLADLITIATVGGIELSVGLGKIRVLTIANVVFGALNILLVLSLTRGLDLGLAAVAWVYFGIFFVRSGLVLPVWMARQLGISPLSYYRESYKGPLITAAMAIPLLVLIREVVPVGGWAMVLVAAVAFVVVLAPLVYFLALDAYDRQVVASGLAQIRATLQPTRGEATGTSDGDPDS